MPDTRQELSDAIDALTPEQQRRVLDLLRSLTGGEGGPDAPAAHGDGAKNQPPATGSSTDDLSDKREDDAEPSQEEINRRSTALDELIGSVDAEPFADDIDDKLYGPKEPSDWAKRAIQQIDRLADAEGHKPVESDEIDKIIYGL